MEPHSAGRFTQQDTHLLVRKVLDFLFIMTILFPLLRIIPYFSLLFSVFQASPRFHMPQTLVFLHRLRYVLSILLLLTTHLSLVYIQIGDYNIQTLVFLHRLSIYSNRL